jgi:RNA polymerase sigma-70 factor (ECF subfamily)
MQIEIDLIQRCISNERSAQRQLYDRLLPYLTTIASRYLVDRSFLKDVLQEAFIDLFKNMDKYDPGRASFKTWAVRILINQCLKANRTKSNIMYMDGSIADVPSHIDSGILNQLEDEVLLRFLKSMPPDYYSVFNLHVLDGFSHKEVAEILSISEDSSRKRLSRARLWLEEHTDTKKRELVWVDAKRIKN